MSDFFTHLVGQVIQPSLDVIPDIPVRFAPVANVPGSELAPEPPVLDTLFQPAPAAPADRMGVEQSSTTAANSPVIPKTLAAGVVRPNPAVTGAQTLPDHAKAEKDYPTAGKRPGSENVAPAFTSAPYETRPIALPVALPTEGNELTRSSARPSNAQPTARLDPPGNASEVQRGQPPEVVPSTVLPIIRPAGRPESPVGQPLSASSATGSEAPGATERFSMPIVRSTGSLSPLEPLEPPLELPSSAVPGPDLAVPRAPASSFTQPEPLASLQAGEIALPSRAKADAKISNVAFRPQPPQKSQQAATNSLPEILPLVKPAAAQTAPPLTSLSPPPASSELRHAAAEADVPQVKATFPASVISPQTPEANRPGTILAAPLSHTASSAQPKGAQRQTQPAHSPAGSRFAPIPAIDPGPIETAGPAAPETQRPPGTSDPRPAPQPEMAAKQPLLPPELNPKSFIQPVLGADLPLDSKSLSSRSGTDETAIPSVHLTIGRIVVKTAPTTAPTASRPVPIRRQPAVSLHDYLNRHGDDQ